MSCVDLTQCDDEKTSWQRSTSSVESHDDRGSTNDDQLTMTDGFDANKCLAGSGGLASDEVSDGCVACRMNRSLDVKNTYTLETASSSLCSVSGRKKKQNT